MLELNIDSLTANIDERNPCGIDLRLLEENSTGFIQYSSLKDTRNNLRREERKNVEVEHDLTIDVRSWQVVKDLAIKLLSNHVKDIEIMSWLLESLVRVDKFAGLICGFDIFSALIEKYRDNLYPSLDDDEDLDSKLASILMLGGKYEIGTLVIPLYCHKIIPTRSGDDLNAWDIKQFLAKANTSEGDVRASALNDCKEVKNAIAGVIKEDFLQCAAEVGSCKAAFLKFNSSLSSVFAKNAPNLDSLDKAINYCLGIVNSVTEIVQRKTVNASIPVDDSIQKSGVQANNESSDVNTASRSFSIDNLTYDQITREDAVKLLDMLMTFFRISDPHSPISYSLERLVRWVKFNLPQIMNEIVGDSMMKEYSKITGVPFVPSTNNIDENYEDDNRYDENYEDDNCDDDN